jgi:hypothetical protein
MTITRSVVKSEHIESGKSNLVPHKTLSDAELETLYTALCNGMETLHQQSEAQMGRARILFYALSAFLMERGIVDDMARARCPGVWRTRAYRFAKLICTRSPARLASSGRTPVRCNRTRTRPAQHQPRPERTGTHIAARRGMPREDGCRMPNPGIDGVFAF